MPEMLELYRNDNRVATIAGSNYELGHGQRRGQLLFFSARLCLGLGHVAPRLDGR